MLQARRLPADLFPRCLAPRIVADIAASSGDAERAASVI
jgi:hypothetical protein